MQYCPTCNVPMAVRDTRKRELLDTDGNVYIFILRRLKCSVCGSIHIELPDIMIPHKHYDAKTINAVIDGKCDYCAADDSTIRRWRK